MEKKYIKARAKINLTLNVLDKRADGYHNLESVFQIINLYDELYIEKTDSNVLELNCNIKGLENENNILYKTYDILKQKRANIAGVKVNLIKNIPYEAGLGGGSSDCASFLISINELFKLNYTKSDLINIGKDIGADVPPCLNKSAFFAEGIGEIITPIDTNMKYYIVLIMPNISCNTKSMFENIDKKGYIKQEYNSKSVVKALEKNNIDLLCNNLYNVFEQALDDNTGINTIKNLLTQNGAKASLMTGSGSCVFGIFDNKDLSKKAYNNLRRLYKTFWCIPNN